jgi:SAM-dependent methyltransferase
MQPNWSEIWQAKGGKNCAESSSTELLSLLEPMELSGYDGKHGTHSVGTLKLKVDSLPSNFHQIVAKADVRILEIGCGAGAFLKVLEEEHTLNVGGVDFSSNLLEFAKNNLIAKLGLCKSEANHDVGILKLDRVFSSSTCHYFSSEVRISNVESYDFIPCSR